MQREEDFVKFKKAHQRDQEELDAEINKIQRRMKHGIELTAIVKLHKQVTLKTREIDLVDDVKFKKINSQLRSKKSIFSKISSFYNERRYKDSFT